MSHVVRSESTFDRSRVPRVAIESRSESSEPVPRAKPSGHVASDLRPVRDLSSVRPGLSASASTWMSSRANRCGIGRRLQHVIWPENARDL